jgi:hypothetical protein
MEKMKSTVCYWPREDVIIIKHEMTFDSGRVSQLYEFAPNDITYNLYLKYPKDPSILYSHEYEELGEL